MELTSRSHAAIAALMNKGVSIPNPLTIDIGNEVDLDRISGSGVILYPGCRIYGSSTVIGPGCRIGQEGPATIDSCQLGPGVEVKGGSFKQSVFLEKANMALGAHVREACILEEEANGAHCVGLKQTILFPFVTLGSLINFCDCLMAGGTSRKNHSEVGSSYIHFNFTPDGNKTTASLIGDVPRGVMLNQPPIFLGGQGGMVGPRVVSYGTVVAAGSILRHDVDEDNQIVVARTPPPMTRPFPARSYPNLTRVIGLNINYLAHLVALRQWYTRVRRPFFSSQEFGDFIYAGCLEKLELALQERTKRLAAMVATIPAEHAQCGCGTKTARQRCELHDNIEAICGLFTDAPSTDQTSRLRDSFLTALDDHTAHGNQRYVEAIQCLPGDAAQQGTRWLQHIIDDLRERAAGMVPSLGLIQQ